MSLPVDISVVLIVDCVILDSPGLPSNFEVKKGLQFHMKFNDESHPAVFANCDQPLSVGSRGEAEIMLTALAEESDLTQPGLDVDFVGGVDIQFATGKVVRVKEIR